MENDSIRSMGGSTLVDIWINGKVRGICVSREAIETFLGLSTDKAAAMSDDDRSEFVRTNLPLVVTSARNQLRATDPAADTVLIGPGQLQRSGRVGDRRKGERRKGGERRKPEPPGPRAPGDRRQADRRRGDRRRGERRTPPKG